MSKSMIRRVSPLCGAALLSLSLMACGDKNGPGAAVPDGTQVNTPATGGPGVATGPGGQFAITDTPSSGEAATNRPQMNASAAQSYLAGLNAFQAGDLKTAEAQFKAATGADPNAYQAFYSLGVVYERLGREGSADTAYRKAVSIVSDYEPAIVALGVMLAGAGKVNEAESYLQGKENKMPKSAAVTAALAEIKSISGDSGAAQRLAQEALKKNPNYRPAMVTIARDHYRTRRLDLALYTLKGILEGYDAENPPRDKNNADALLLRGLIFKEQSRRKPAMDDFKRAIELRPDLVEARVQLATYLMESGNAAEAAQLLEGALRYDAVNSYAHLNLGDAYRLLGKVAEAKQELEWVIKKDPTLAQAHYNLGLLYLSASAIPGVTPKQAADKAIDEFEQYKKMKPHGAGSGPDDTDELITRAKTKKALIESEKSAPPPTKPAAPAAGSTPPATGTGGASKPAGSTGSLPPAGEKK